MSRRDNLIEKLKRRPRDVSRSELTTLLAGLGYVEVRRGKTGGSRRRFTHATGATMSLHAPHPGNVLKAYQVELVLETLEQEGLP